MRRDGPNQHGTVDAYDPLHPNHWPSDDPAVVRTRTYRGHFCAQRNPYQFWVIVGREGGEPLSPKLKEGSFTDLAFCQAAIDDAVKSEAQP